MNHTSMQQGGGAHQLCTKSTLLHGLVLALRAFLVVCALRATTGASSRRRQLASPGSWEGSASAVQQGLPVPVTMHLPCASTFPPDGRPYILRNRPSGRASHAGRGLMGPSPAADGVMHIGPARDGIAVSGEVPMTFKCRCQDNDHEFCPSGGSCKSSWAQTGDNIDITAAEGESWELPQLSCGQTWTKTIKVEYSSPESVSSGRTTVTLSIECEG